MTKHDLETTKQRENEGLSDFVNRFRDKTVKMIDRPSEPEQIEILLDNLREPLKQRLVAVDIMSYATLKKVGTRVESYISAQTALEAPTKGYFGKKPYGSSSTAPGPNVNTLSVVTEPRSRRNYSEIGMNLSQTLKRLVKSGHLNPIGPIEEPAVKGPSWNENTYCEYHQGKGHDTNGCNALRHAIQDLIDDGTIPVQKATK